MAFLALEIYVLHVYDGVRTAQLGVAGAPSPRAVVRARDRKLGNDKICYHTIVSELNLDGTCLNIAGTRKLYFIVNKL